MSRIVVASAALTTNGVLGANWLNTNNFGAGDAVVSNNRFQNNNSNAPGNDFGSSAIWVGSGAFDADNLWAGIELIGVQDITPSYWGGVILASTTDTYTARDHYGLVVQYTGGPPWPTLLFKVVNGTYTLIDSALVTWADGDTIELERIGSGFLCYQNGVIISALSGNTDTDLVATIPGAVISSQNVAGFPGLINWQAGNFGSSGGPVFYPMETTLYV